MRARTRVIRSVAPRDAVHTLRSLLFIDSRTASPRPLPSLPLPSRRSGSTIRIGEAPIRRSGPPRHREITGVGPPRTPRNPRRARARDPKSVVRILRTTASSSASRPCSVDEVRCRQATVASGRRSFLPWALFLFEVRRDSEGSSRAWLAAPAGSMRHRSGESESPKGGPAVDARARRRRAADHPDPSEASPVATSRGGRPGSLSGNRVVRCLVATRSFPGRTRLGASPCGEVPKRRTGGRRAPRGGLTDLHEVLDVKDRSEEQSLGRTRWHWSVGLPPLGVTQHPALWSPDFPPAASPRPAIIQLPSSKFIIPCLASQSPPLSNP
jgi:hypothetical protein